jgi:L-alanine-DL-glutamate epimerase-like enolase superfamily enzyme
MTSNTAHQKVALHNRSHDDPLPRIKSLEWFRVKPRWLFVKLVDDSGGFGWGEATLEGHDKAVEGALSEMADRLVGYVAECATTPFPFLAFPVGRRCG